MHPHQDPWHIHKDQSTAKARNIDHKCRKQHTNKVYPFAVSCELCAEHRADNPRQVNQPACNVVRIDRERKHRDHDTDITKYLFRAAEDGE